MSTLMSLHPTFVRSKRDIHLAIRSLIHKRFKFEDVLERLYGTTKIHPQRKVRLLAVLDEYDKAGLTKKVVGRGRKYRFEPMTEEPTDCQIGWRVYLNMAYKKQIAKDVRAREFFEHLV